MDSVNEELAEKAEKLQKEFERDTRLEEQRMEDVKVFEENGQKISHLGFDKLSDFEIAIREVKSALKDYDVLLLENQKEMIEIVKEIDLFKAHPELCIKGQLEQLENKYVSLCDKKLRLEESKYKEEQNLAKLNEAKKRYLNNRKITLREEMKDRKKIREQYYYAVEEAKKLNEKIYKGEANDFDKKRCQELQKDIIPTLYSKMKLTQNEMPSNLNYEELGETMTVDEMTTILNMYASNNIDKDILEKIANKLGVSPDDLVDIAKKKEEMLKEKDALESGEKKEAPKEEKTEDVDKKNDKDKDEDQSSKDEETKDEEAEKESGKSMTEPAEGRKKVSFIKQATQKIRDALSKTSTKAFIALASAVVIVAAALANPAFIAIGAAGYGVYQYNKGKKMS